MPESPEDMEEEDLDALQQQMDEDYELATGMDRGVVVGGVWCAADGCSHRRLTRSMHTLNWPHVRPVNEGRRQCLERLWLEGTHRVPVHVFPATC